MTTKCAIKVALSVLNEELNWSLSAEIDRFVSASIGVVLFELM